jgi:N-acetylmuramoyl-L-alanine amidase
VDYLAAQNTVVVVFPRADMRSVQLEPASGYDRIVIELSQSVPIETRRLPALDAVQFRFLRTDLDQEQQLSGQYVRSGTVASRSGHVDVRLSLAPDSEVDVFTSQQDGRTLVVIDVFSDERSDDRQTATSLQPLRITLDPGHGGRQDGLELAGSSEAALTLEAAQNLALALRRRGHEVRLTREDGVSLPARERANAGLGQDMLLSLHAADLVPGSVNVFYLGDAETIQGLDYALFENAEQVQRLDTDAVRRQVLLNLIPDVTLGERYARSLSRVLAQNYGVRTNALEPVPLTVLAGAAGRGVLLEASANDLQSVAFADNLAASLEQIIREASTP